MEPSPPKRAKKEGEQPQEASPKSVTVMPEGRSGLCPSLRLCVDKWGLFPPYASPDEDEKWAEYYSERSALEFRHSHFFVDDETGKELKTYSRCYRDSFGRECRNAEIIAADEKDPDRCAKCKKVYGGKNSEYLVEVTDAVREAWAELVKSDVCLRAVYGGSPFLAKRPPFMGPHCIESYAEDCHESGTARGEYEDFIGRIRERVIATLKTANIDNKNEFAKRAASGLFVLSYHANFEESGVDADVRTVEFGTRLYSPTGNGKCFDLHWYRHYRQRMTIAPEKYSNLYAIERNLGMYDPMRPTHTYLNWREEDEDSALAILDGDTDENRVIKSFATLPKLKEMRSVIFGDDSTIAERVSTRKVFGLLARAAGAHIVRGEGGWVFAGMRKRYELYPGEESDGEEDGEEDGPGCVIC